MVLVPRSIKYLSRKQQTGSGALGMLILLPLILLTLILMLDLGRQLMVRSLLAEAVEEVTRRIMAEQNLRSSGISPQDHAQIFWQAIKQQQWLLAQTELENGAPMAAYFNDRDEVLAVDADYTGSGWDSENSCCVLFNWQFRSKGALTAFQQVAGFGWNELDLTHKRFLILPQDAISSAAGNGGG